MPRLHHESWGDFHKVHHSDSWKCSSQNESNLGSGRSTFMQSGKGNLRRGGKPNMIKHGNASFGDFGNTSVRDLFRKEGAGSELQKDALRKEHSNDSLNGGSGHRTRRGSLGKDNSLTSVGGGKERTKRGTLRTNNSANFSPSDEKISTVRRGLCKQGSFVSRGNPTGRTGRRDLLERTKSQPALLKGMTVRGHESFNASFDGSFNPKSRKTFSSERRPSFGYINQPAGEDIQPNQVWEVRPRCRSSFGDKEMLVGDANVQTSRADKSMDKSMIHDNSYDLNNHNSFDEEPSLELTAETESETFAETNHLSSTNDIIDPKEHQEDPPAATQLGGDDSTEAETENECLSVESIPSADTSPFEANGFDQMETFFSSVCAKLEEQNDEVEFVATKKKKSFFGRKSRKRCSRRC